MDTCGNAASRAWEMTFISLEPEGLTGTTGWSSKAGMAERSGPSRILSGWTRADRRRRMRSLPMMREIFMLQAQPGGVVRLKIQGPDSLPLENVTAELLKSKDSLLAKASISDKQGTVIFENIKPGDYFIKLSMIGFGAYLSPGFNITADRGYDAGSIIMKTERAGEMKAVVVSAKKPFIQKLNDRLVVNVESSIIGAGSSAMDILERAPGVSIDQNDVIGLRGRTGVIIMVDGKPTPMTGADLATYLRGLPSGAIERIDIITNPSSKYDAAGNSGIIDIRMKKDQRVGMNGSLTAGYGQGIYPKANAGVTFNYRNKKINVFDAFIECAIPCS
ncbi:MAG: hypothetical protein EOP49_35990 [Sphingobacteriales bacterium]|nr:MAG: hypothetical protein EOP49_35990 [Sphingobacteriales bacterium]